MYLLLRHRAPLRAVTPNGLVRSFVCRSVCVKDYLLSPWLGPSIFSVMAASSSEFNVAYDQQFLRATEAAASDLSEELKLTTSLKSNAGKPLLDISFLKNECIEHSSEMQSTECEAFFSNTALINRLFSHSPWLSGKAWVCLRTERLLKIACLSGKCQDFPGSAQLYKNIQLIRVAI